MVSHTPAEGLRSSDRALRLKALKSLKNEIIGSKSKKLQLLSLLPEVVALANKVETDREELIQSAATLGSFAYGVDDGVRAVVAQGAVQTLLRALGSTDEAVVEAAARSLKLIYRSPLAPHDPLLQAPALRTLVGLLRGSKPHLSEVSASVLARCCATARESAAVADAGAVPALLAMLASPRLSTQQAALEALAAIVGGGRPCSAACPNARGAGGSPITEDPLPAHLEQLLDAIFAPAAAAEEAAASEEQEQEHVVLAHLRALLRLSPNPMTRFRVAVVIAGLTTAATARGRAAAVAQPAAEPAVPEKQQLQQQGPLQQLQETSRVVLPGLVKLLQQAVAQPDSGGSASNGMKQAQQQVPWGSGGGSGLSRDGPGDITGDGVARVLADLMTDNDELMKAALDADAVKLLCSCLAAATQQQPVSPEAAGGAAGAERKAPRRPRAGVLRALGTLCLNHEDARAQVVMAKAVPHITSALADPDDATRAAAVVCVRGLSNSARSLRICVVDAGVASPLVKLLSDDSSAVQVNAASAICNLVLDFRSIRQAVLQAGALARLVPLAGSMLPELRAGAVRALANLTIKCEDAATRQALLRELSWGAMRALLADPEPEVATEAASLLQNLFAASSEGIQELFSWSGGDILPLLEERLDPCAAAAGAAGPRGLEATLYAVANLCSGSEEHKAAVMASNVPALLLHQLRAPAVPPAGAAAAQGAAAAGGGAAGAACGGGAGGRVAGRPGGEASSGAPSTAQVRVPAVWAVINLLWYDSAAHPTAPPPEVAARARKLRELGLEAALKALANDDSQDLRERVQTALEQLA